MTTLFALRSLKCALPAVQTCTRTLVNRAALRPPPAPRGSSNPGTIDSPTAFLTSIGRSAEKKLPDIENLTWEDLWKMDGAALKKAGVSVKDRRYILWSMEKFRLGESPETFAHPPRPKKKIRGWGPKIQNGKINRSRRQR